MKDKTSWDPRVSAADGAESHAAVPGPSDWMFLQPAILDQMHDSIITTDLDGIVTGCNRAATHVFGYTAEELIGQHVGLLYPPEEAQFLRETVIPTLHKTGHFRGELRNVTRSGAYIYIHLSVNLLRDSEGRPAGMVGFSIEVTAQKLAELALRGQQAAERQLELTAQSSGLSLQRLAHKLAEAHRIAKLGTWEWDTTTDTITWSDEVYRLHEYDVNLPPPTFELLREMYTPESAKRIQVAVGMAIQNGEPYEVDLELKLPGGGSRWIIGRGEPDGEFNGRVTRLRGTVQDITERKRVESELRASESRFRKLFESDLMGIGIPDRFGSFSEANDELLRLVGYTRDDLEAGLVRWDTMTPPEYQALDQAHIAEAAQRGFCTPYQKEYIRKDGSRLPIMCGYALLEGSQDQYIGFVQDLSSQKRAEEALRQAEKLTTAGRFAASMAHEINNPLAAVTNSIYLALRDPDLSNATRDYLQLADQELLRVSRVVSQTLRFHKQLTAPISANVGEIMDSVFPLFKSRMQSLSILVHREYSTQERLLCFSDDLRHAFANLVSNALDAMPHGGKLWIRIGPGKMWNGSGKAGIRVIVADTGQGIPAAVSTRVFQPFVTTKETTGTGLGLWVVEGIIQKHGGRITLRSSTRSEQHGTAFSMFFPFGGLQPGQS